jgi:gliding-associated putative ABC transporter substrate-binding component GldG
MKKRAEIVVFLLGLAIILLAALNSSRFFARLDLTESKAFSISRVSKKLFQEIPEQVHITYYVSERLRKLYAFPQAIEDLLQEYAAYSRGKIRVESLDPLAVGEVTRAEQYGVLPQQIEVVERDETSLAKIYTGIVIQYLDRHETIPLAVRTDALEYELTSRIRKAVSGEERVVGILLGDARRDLQQEYGRLLGGLSADFRVLPLTPGQDVPAEVDALFVIGNSDLGEFELFPIDQYLMRGGRALFAVDGVAVDFMRGLVASKLLNNPTLAMLASYGVKVEPELMADKYCQNFRLPTQILGQVMWQVLDKYPYWITVAGQFASSDNPITAHFTGLDLYWASPLTLSALGERSATGGAVVEPLITSTPDGWTLDEEPFDTNPEAARMLLFSEPENAGTRVLAASLRGELASWFRGKDIPTREGESRAWQSVVATAKDARLVVVGDADFASNLMDFTEAAYNVGFLTNAAEWLSNSEDLLSIKTRLSRDVRLNRIQDPDHRRAAVLTTEIVNVALIPLAIVGFGVARLLLRRKKSAVRAEEE